MAFLNLFILGTGLSLEERIDWDPLLLAAATFLILIGLGVVWMFTAALQRKASALTASRLMLLST
jgi:hypothetical protein